MLKTVGQILVSDDPAEGLSTLAEEVRQEAKADLGNYKPEQVGEGKAPSIDTTAEVVDEKTE
jgi:hypothetical protein